MVKKNSIPDRWRSLKSVGQRIPGSRFVAFKVPLKGLLNQRLTPNQKFTPKDLLNEIRERNEELGLIIDLANTERYYTYKDLPKSVQYVKLHTAGLQIPDDCTIHQFKRVIRRFLWSNAENDKLIGVHCTTGINRTGYLICRYLIDVDGWDPQTTVKAFAEARGHPIEGTVYLEDLLTGPTRTNLGIDQAPADEEAQDPDNGGNMPRSEKFLKEECGVRERFRENDLENDFGDFDARKMPKRMPMEKPHGVFKDEREFQHCMPEYMDRAQMAQYGSNFQMRDAMESPEFDSPFGPRNNQFYDNMMNARMRNTPEMFQKMNNMNRPIPPDLEAEMRDYTRMLENRRELHGNHPMNYDPGHAMKNHDDNFEFGPRSSHSIPQGAQCENCDCGIRPRDRPNPVHGPVSHEFHPEMQFKDINGPRAREFPPEMQYKDFNGPRAREFHPEIQFKDINGPRAREFPPEMQYKDFNGPRAREFAPEMQCRDFNGPRAREFPPEMQCKNFNGPRAREFPPEMQCKDFNGSRAREFPPEMQCKDFNGPRAREFPPEMQCNDFNGPRTREFPPEMQCKDFNGPRVCEFPPEMQSKNFNGPRARAFPPEMQGKDFNGPRAREFPPEMQGQDFNGPRAREFPPEMQGQDFNGPRAREFPQEMQGKDFNGPHAREFPAQMQCKDCNCPHSRAVPSEMQFKDFNDSRPREFPSEMQFKDCKYPGPLAGPVQRSNVPFSRGYQPEMDKADFAKTEAQRKFQPRRGLESSSLNSELATHDREARFLDTQRQNVKVGLANARNLHEDHGIHAKELEMRQGRLQAQHMEGSFDHTNPAEYEYLKNKAQFMQERSRGDIPTDYETRASERRNMPSSGDYFRGPNRFAPYPTQMKPLQHNDSIRDFEQGPMVHGNRYAHGGMTPGAYNSSFGKSMGEEHMHKDFPQQNRFNPN
ncbi:uncharacterized protein WCC33_012269 [Rhinophrynus dorsalis]